MNQYPTWKYVLIGLVVTLTFLYALPNIYGKDPAVQISPEYASNVVVDDALVSRIEAMLRSANIAVKRMDKEGQHVLFRFADIKTQITAYSLLKDKLRGYVVAQNLAASTPAWLRAINANPMYLGLDLRGGVHFLMEVDMVSAIKQDEERFVQEFRSLLREKKVRYSRIWRPDSGGVQLMFKTAEIRDKARFIIGSKNEELNAQDRDEQDKFGVIFHYNQQAMRDAKAAAVEQNITTLRNRINELGVAEPVIQRQGEDRIVVQLPGIQDTTRAKEVLGATATLEFRLVGEKGPNTREYPNREGGTTWLKRSVIVTGNQINNADSTIDQQSGRPAVRVVLDGKGSKRMFDTTSKNVKKPMAVIFIEHKVEKIIKADGSVLKKKKRIEEVINIATIQEAFGKTFQITGLAPKEANNLALLLRAGALKAPVEIVEERTIGPSLGAENIKKGFMSILVGFIAVLLFMLYRYRQFGMIANVALLLNVIIVIALLSLLQATLTLPGIAGILLTIGMAIDANVLIFERIREEIQMGSSPQASIFAGYEKAFSTIFDANITTLIAGVVLFSFGSGPVKGFAVTLSLGIITSMFTAIMVSRAMVNYQYGNKRLQKLPI